MRVLLTGATGLIGRQCTAPLTDAGFEVIAASRRGAAVPGAEALALDLLDPGAVRAALAEARPTHLVHLAWHDSPQGRWTAPANLDWAAATLTLLRAFAEAGGTRAVCAGSCAEYGWDRPVLAEDSPLKPATLYGAAKARAGQLALAGAGAMGLRLAWARIFFCYGPGEPPGRLLGDLVAGLRAGQQVDCTDGLQERDFLHTADIGRALAAILASPADGAVNIGSGRAVPVRDVIETAARLVGRPDLIRLGARPRPAGDPPRLEADATRLTTEVGFRPGFDLEAGLAATLAEAP